MTASFTNVEQVPLDRLRPYPDNPRKGDVDMIVESLTVHGQYRPIVARRDGTVLAGNHTLRAAKKAGMAEVAVAWVDVDDDEARRIVLADNRMSDRATNDTQSLIQMLEAMPDLTGTGWDEDSLTGLWVAEDQSILPSDWPEGVEPPDPEERPQVEPPPGGGEPRDDAPAKPVKCRVGGWRWQATPDGFAAWEGLLLADVDGDRRAALRALRDRLAFPKPPKAPKPDRPPEVTHGPVETVDVGSLLLIEGHWRHGDVGAVTESLAAHGQYRPLVVNGNGVVIVGNSTLQAAVALGWETVDIVRVDVDPVESAKIALVDNRTTDVAGYDEDTLRSLLLEVGETGSFLGTGFDGDDADDAIAGRPSRPARQTNRTSCQFGDLRVTVRTDAFREWTAQVPPNAPERWLADRVGMPHEICLWTEGTADG